MSDEQDSMLDAAGDFVSSGVDAVSRAAAGMGHIAEFYGDALQAEGARIAAAGDELIGDTAGRDAWEQRSRDNVDEAFWDVDQASLAFTDAGEHIWGGGEESSVPAGPPVDEMMRTDQAEPEPEPASTPDFDPNVPATGGV